MNTCVTCGHFQRGGEQGGQAVGLCTRFPPVPLMTAIQGMATKENPQGHYIVPVSYRPQVRGLDGCGEHVTMPNDKQKRLPLP